MSVTIYKSKLGREDIFIDAAAHDVLKSDGTTYRTVNGLAASFLLLSGGTITGAMIFQGAVSMTAASTALAVTNNVTIGGTLAVTGAATVGGTLGVTGAVTLASTLGVTGAATLAAATATSLVVAGAGGTQALRTTTLYASGASTLIGAATLSSTLYVNGATTMVALSYALAGLYITGGITMSGATALTALSATGKFAAVEIAAASDAGYVLNTTTLRATGNVLFAAGNLTVTAGNLVVGGTSTLTGAVTSAGEGSFVGLTNSGCTVLTGISIDTETGATLKNSGYTTIVFSQTGARTVDQTLTAFTGYTLLLVNNSASNVTLSATLVLGTALVLEPKDSCVIQYLSGVLGWAVMSYYNEDAPGA